MLDPTVVVSQLDAAIYAYDEARKRSKYDDLSDLPDAVCSELISRFASAVDRLAPPGSQYRINALDSVKQYGASNSYNLQVLVGILKALRGDYAAGYLLSLEQLIGANLFSDFIEMAQHLLEQGYKDPAAVLAGGVLEEHLRLLCSRHGVPIEVGGKPKKADSMNADLATTGVYQKLDHKSVTAWLDLRNMAAHGKYVEYSSDQVQLMLHGVRDFLTRHP